MAQSTSRRHLSSDFQRAINRWSTETPKALSLTAAEQQSEPPQQCRESAARRLHDDMRPAATGEHRVRRARGKSPRSLALIERASSILSEIQPATVRAVCYRLFALGVIDAMTKGETNRVSAQLTWAREQGRIPWGWIVDETRAAERINAWENPAAYIETVQRSYRRDRWTDQREWIEVWSEKGTIRGTLKPVLDEYGVTFRVMHGYGSATAVHQAAQDSQRGEKRLTVFYVGDHDPSGLHMSAVDLPRRLAQYGGALDLIRLALTNDDTRGALPSFPAETKRQDARFQWYVDRHGQRCWELDALSPVSLRGRVKEAIVARLDLDAWRRAEVAERAECDSLRSILRTWPSTCGLASKCPDGQA